MNENQQFNISADITKDARFNEMMGFTKEELTKLMKNSPTYEEQAFYRALDQLMLRQAQRLINAAGELDGRSWADK